MRGEFFGFCEEKRVGRQQPSLLYFVVLLHFHHLHGLACLAKLLRFAPTKNSDPTIEVAQLWSDLKHLVRFLLEVHL